MRAWWFGLGLALLASATTGVQAENLDAPAGVNLSKRSVVDSLGRSITYYVSRPDKPAPLMLLIQGSGCTPIFVQTSTGVASTVSGLLAAAHEGRFTVLVVDKPFDGEPLGAQRGTATACSAAFNDDFTAERWLEALDAAMTDARKLPWVDQSRTLVWGHSEGAAMAALVAGREPFVTDVVWLAGSATTQLFDQFAIDNATCFDRSRCLEEHERGVRAILAKPDSGSDFIWGHAYRRWASFYRTSSVRALLKSQARVYAADGTRDTNTSPMSLELLGAELISAGHDVTVRRVPDADHGLNGPQSTTDREYGRALAWFWAGGRQHDVSATATARQTAGAPR